MRRWAHGLVDAAREPDRVAEIDYWREVLEGPDPTLGVRALTKRDTASATIDIEVRVPTGLTEAVSTTVPQAIHGSVEDGLLTALALAMVRWRMDRGIDNPETLISLEGHGREEQVVPGADLARTVGWFTTIFPVRIDLSGVDPVDAFAGGPAAGVAAKTVKEQLRAVPDRGIGFGLLRYLNRETAHTLSQLPVPQISFNYLGRVGGTDADASAGWVPIRDEDLRDGCGRRSPTRQRPRGQRDDGRQRYRGRSAARCRLDVPTGHSGCGRRSATGAVVARRTGRARRVRGGRRRIHTLGLRSGRSSTGGDRRPRKSVSRPERCLATLSTASGVVVPRPNWPNDRSTHTSYKWLSIWPAQSIRSACAAPPTRCSAGMRTCVPPSFTAPTAVPSRWSEATWQRRGRKSTSLVHQIRKLIERWPRTERRPFDMARAPLIRFTLIALAPEKFTLVLTNHHILLDGWSMPLLIRELATLYAADGQVAALPHARAYRDYLTWMSRRDQQASRAVWARTLSGVEGPTLLAPAVRSRRLSTMAAEWVFDLDEEFTTSLRGMARELGLTINTIVQASWGIVLAALTGRDDVVFGATVSGRPPELTGIETMVGLFINTIPVRITLRPSESIGNTPRADPGRASRAVGSPLSRAFRDPRRRGAGDRIRHVDCLRIVSR